MDLMNYCKKHRRNKSPLSSQPETSSSCLPELKAFNNLPSCWTHSNIHVCLVLVTPALATALQVCPTLLSRGPGSPPQPSGDAPPVAALAQGHIAGLWSSCAPGPSGPSLPGCSPAGQSESVLCRAWFLPRGRKLLSFMNTLAFFSRLVGSLSVVAKPSHVSTTSLNSNSTSECGC